MRRLLRSGLLLLFIGGFALAPAASAAQISAAYIPYSTYIYDYNGNPVTTPHAYVPSAMYGGRDFGAGDLSFPSDITCGPEGDLYICDAGNNRVLRLDKNFRLLAEIRGFEGPRGPESFSGPQGMFVDEQYLYVADTKNSRIVKLTKDGKFVQEYGAPKTTLLDDDFLYAPVALAADRTGNLFVVAQGVNKGLLRFNRDGEFVAFFGAQDATYSVMDYVWKRFMTEEQLKRMQDFVPTEYNNLVIDKQGFLYATTNDLDLSVFLSNLRSRAQSSSAAPVRKLNPVGNDVLDRGGYFPPVGDVKFGRDETNTEAISIITDIALGPDGSYTLLDTRENRLFTYSASGDLLYAFSASGRQTGNSEAPCSIVYSGTDLLLLDRTSGRVTVFSQTEYGALIDRALALYGSFRYDESVKLWEDVLKLNANFDIAYDGIGASFLSQGEYGKAMEYFNYSNNKAAYSDAFREYRNDLARRYLWLAALLAAGLIAGAALLLRYIGRRNRAPAYKDRQRTFSGRLLYGFYVMTHPFDGFYDLKLEKRGSIGASAVILFAGMSAVVGSKLFMSYLFNENYTQDISVVKEYATLLIPVLLWVLSNWCVTSLMDGEGRLRDIFLFTGYALLPVALLYCVMVPLSYILVAQEAMYLAFLGRAALLWFVFLLFCGNTVIHQYTAFKSVLSILISILGIAVLIFVMLLLLTSYQKLFSLVVNIYQEITFRQ